MHKFKKIASLMASTLMVGSTIGLAAAASYPAPFVTGGTANVALVYGSHSAATVDLVAVMKVQDSLNTYLTGGSGSDGGGSSISGGDYVLLAKSSDNLNLNNNWGVFTGSIDDEDLSTVLADGTYKADDNDEFDYTQKISVGTPTLTHFRDSDYEDLVGLTERTPVIGFKIGSNTYVLNYTLDFSTDAESDIAGSDLDDIEGSFLPLFGKNYFVSNLDQSADGNFLGKLTLLDSAVQGIVNEGETSTKTIDGVSYDISINWMDSDSVKFTVNGETTNQLAKGDSYKLNDGTYIGATDITKLEVSGEVGSAEFSLGSGKLDITSNAEVKLNDDPVSGVKGWVFAGSGNTSGTERIDKISIEWKTDEEVFLSPDVELLMPGFKAVKFTMGDIVRSEEEMIKIEKDGDNSMGLTLPLKDGVVDFNILYNDATTGNFTGIGKASDEELATSGTNTLTFYEKFNGADKHSWFVATYNISSEAESYLLRAKVSKDTSSNRNETSIEKNVGGTWTEVCTDKTDGDTCDIGLITLTMTTVTYLSGGNESVLFTAGSEVNFNTLYTPGGLKMWLPYNAATNVSGSIFLATSADGVTTSGVVSGGSLVTGHGPEDWFLEMYEEDKNDDVASGVEFNLTIDDTTSTNNPLQVSQINRAGTGGSANAATWGGLEKGDSTSIYEFYIKSDVATRGLHFTKPDEDYAEIYYPSGDSETYGEVYLAESDVTIDGGSAPVGGGGGSTTVGVAITDSEVGSASGKNLIVVGGSCVNSVAADLIGSATPLCGGDWTAVTNVGSGEFLIETFDQSDDTVATLIGGYGAGDTQNAATFLTTQDAVDTTAGAKYIGTSSTNAEMVTSDGGGEEA